MDRFDAEHSTRVKSFIAQLQPRDWNRMDGWEAKEDFDDRWDLDRYFDWPPDVFVLTSLLLQTSGAYRYAVMPPEGEKWPDDEWPQRCLEMAQKWREWICMPPAQRNPHPLREWIEMLKARSHVRINELYSLEGLRKREQRDAWELCRTLLDLHAIADETMRGVGTLFAPRMSLMQLGEPAPEGIEFMHLQANILLTLRGTLSRIGKHRGIVLPKMKTAEAGLTLRSLSHHLSFHSSEVNVAWRAVPWANIDEDTVNALIIPWPYEIERSAFKKINRSGRTRYFRYLPNAKLNPAEIVRCVLGAKDKATRVHLLIFPESALTPKELERLQLMLERELQPHEMPVILAGVRGLIGPKESSGSMGNNRVVLSVYYAGKWYEMLQDKHHRWRLDRSQIKTYEIGGFLEPNFVHWEAIQIPRRQLSFLTSRSWLAITPLICEDLARLDPVSNLIRGVGPTLIVALLLDGPQIKGRWPDLYTSVFADDPGTSILTVTALGMTDLSKPDGIPEKDINAAKGVIGSWREPIGERQEIRYSPSDEFYLPMLTIVSQKNPCEAIDMRSKLENTVFCFHSISGIHPRKKQIAERSADTDSIDLTNHGTPDVVIASDAQKSADMIELSLYSFFVDALIDVPLGQEEEMLDWMRKAVGIGRDDDRFHHEKPTEVFREILQLLRWTRFRSSVPSEIPTPQFLYGIATVTDLVKRARNGSHYGYATSLEILAASAIHDLEQCVEQLRNGSFAESVKIEEVRERYVTDAAMAYADWPEDERGKEQRFSCSDIARLRMSAAQSVLWAVHNRLLANKNALFDKIDKKLQSNFNKVYLRWSEAHQKKRYQATGNKRCPLCALPPNQIQNEI